MSIQIGFNGRFFPANWRPAREEIAFGRMHGFSALQFMGKEEGLSEQHLGDELAVLRDLLCAAGLTAVMEIVVRIDAHGRTGSGRTPLDVLRANLPAIQTLPCRCVHWHLALLHPADESTIHALETSLKSQFVAAVDLASKHGFRFGFEHNEPALRLFAQPEVCAAMLDAAPGLGFVWDMNHTTVEDLPAFLSLIPRMSMLHVSDTPLPAVNHHLPLGMGTIDFAAYAQALYAGGFSGPAILEIGGLPQSGGYGRDTDAALASSLQHLREALTNP